MIFSPNRPARRLSCGNLAMDLVLDGAHGLVLCLGSAFSILSKYVKLWRLERL